MRIIAGSARGRILVSPQGQETRPTADKVREAVFGALQFELAQARVLDMFAGSGAMGLEALSRGAEQAVFIEKSPAAMKVVKKNAELTHLEQKCVFLQSGFETAELSGRFDFVFIDPPYASGLYRPAVERLLRDGLLAPGARIIAEHNEPLELSLECARQKRYGKTYISVYIYDGTEG